MDPVLLGSADGERITDQPGRFLALKVGLENIAVTESRYAQGERGPDSHIHREHVDAFYVLEGELVFELGTGDERRAGAGTFVAVPPGVIHTFRNDGPADARYVNIHAPGKGFDDYLRGLRDARSDEERSAVMERFDSYDPPADGGRSVEDVVIAAAGAGERLALGDSAAVIKVGAEAADGMLAVLDTTLAPGFPGPVPHRHRRMLDSFWVLEGTLTLRLGERTVEAGPGSYAAVPPGAVHAFANPGEAPVRMLNVMAPAGLEGYLRETTAAATTDPAEMARIAARYDFEPA